MDKIYIYMFMLGVLIFGTANTLISKSMNQQSALGYEFNHPYFQTATMFFGESFCLLAYKAIAKSTKAPISVYIPETENISDRLYQKLGNFVFLIPAFFDLLASTLTFIGLVLSAASVYQMMRGFIIVIVAVNSVVFLKKKLYRHQILGAGLTTFGVCIVGVVSILYQSSSAPNPILGIILILVAQVFHGWMFVSEELFLGKIHIDPLQAVGVEGVCGFLYYLILLPILYFIPCSEDFCINGHVEDTLLAFKQIAANYTLAFTWVASMLSVSLFNWTGISTTKYAGSLARSTVDTSRTFLVWLACMLLGWEQFLWPQLIGFFFLSFGTLVYNEVLILPFASFKKAVQEHQAEKEKHNQAHSVQNAYVAEGFLSEDKPYATSDPSIN
ncbi:hypothetical protein SteCoe_31058 [Stentor coeruleus]|uniref:EamA domain-containing protein n=1 Tax=Stentor coeruleus TaxID=5963 RepID=A0A1R2B268_9CILI|nr:hypothetical protein SteCoe_31058 [Stentor coeruleus]